MVFMALWYAIIFLPLNLSLVVEIIENGFWLLATLLVQRTVVVCGGILVAWSYDFFPG